MKKRIATVVLALVLCLGLAVEVFAYLPSRSYAVVVYPELIPEGTVYIDLLMQIPETNKGYVSYNESNGTLYGIGEESEIVTYCDEEGFVSYTFHISDAYSLVTPTVGYTRFYDIEALYFADLDSIIGKAGGECTVNDDGTRNYVIYTTIYGSEAYRELEALCKKMYDTDELYYLDMYVDYNTTNDETKSGRVSDFDYEYCRKNFRHIKMAYIDAEGDVLGVSNAVDGKWIDGSRFSLTLKGLTLEGAPYNPWRWLPLYLFLALAIPLVIVVAVIVIVVKFVKKWRAQKALGF